MGMCQKRCVMGSAVSELSRIGVKYAWMRERKPQNTTVY